jgi:hypothetical protein
MMEAISSLDLAVLTRAARCSIPRGGILHTPPRLQLCSGIRESRFSLGCSILFHTSAFEINKQNSMAFSPQVNYTDCSVKVVATSVGRGRRVVSATDPYGR